MSAKKRKPTGREPERVKIEGNWKDAVAHALTRGKPSATPVKRKRKRANDK